MNTSKTIGIIGGQGPVSTADFYMRVVKYYQDNYGAKLLQDYPPMIIFSVPAPDLISGVENEEVTYQMMADASKKLEHDGCAFIVIACNSSQFLNDKLQSLIKIPIIGIADVTAKYLHAKGHKKVGVLGTYTTINKNIYGDALDKYGIKVINPNADDQKIVEQVILNENAGEMSDADKNKLIAVMKNLQSQEAEAMLLACTELPLLISQSDTDIKLVDCNELYAFKTAKLSHQTD
jgi:aspartate racemase